MRKRSDQSQWSMSHPSARFVVVQIHQFARQVTRSLRVVFLLFANVDETLGEPISVVDVVAAAAPDPVPVQGLGPGVSAAATVGQLSVSAGPRDRIDHTGRGD